MADKALINCIPIPILTIGVDGIVSATNVAFENFIGAELEGFSYVAALRQPVLLTAIGHAFAKKKETLGLFRVRDGLRDTVFDVAITPHDGGLILVFTDRSAQDDAIEQKRELVANVSHELRTPITAILGFIETLEGAAAEDPDARRRFLGIMSSEAKRMASLVDDLLSLSRVEQDERQRPKETLDLVELTKGVVSSFSPVIEKAGVEVRFQHENPSQLLLGDQQQLQQLLGNLIENGIKYGNSSGGIDVTITTPEHHTELRSNGIVLSVTDYGDGIAKHHIPRLTERFYRIDSHRSRAVGGTGLGLAIVKHIVQRHRGSLKVQSELGVGTTIQVYLPVV